MTKELEALNAKLDLIISKIEYENRVPSIFLAVGDQRKSVLTFIKYWNVN